jgi:thymidylate synthase (FAD)
MKIIDQSWEWLQKPENPLELIEQAGRTCYKSECKGAPEKFVKMLLSRGHETPIEHVSASVKIITNRGVTHELVRHRLASYSQESTRYVNYSGNMEFIRPVWWDNWSGQEQAVWKYAISQAEMSYCDLIKRGNRPEQAREVLPNSLKSEIVMTANLREWRHIFKLRCSKQAHPQIRALMLDMLQGFKKEIPVIFEEI